MATSTHKFIGKAKWCKVINPDEYNGVFTYKTNLIVDEENFKKFQESGIRTKPKETDDGTEIILKRPKEGKELANGNVIGGGQPAIYYEDGSTWDDSFIGNGSDIECTVLVYDSKFGKGHRLESVRVLNHIPYDTPSSTPEASTPEASSAKIPF